MALVRTLSDDAVRRIRTAAQHLHRPRRRSAADLVRHLAGVQAQVLSAAGMALGARTAGLTAEETARARLHDRTIVHTWAMRGTLHLIAAEDVGWLVPLVTEPRVSNARRRLRQEGVPDEQPDRAVRLIGRMLEREGPLTRAEIAERLRRRGIETRGQAMAHLLWLAAAEGVTCYGPGRGRERRFVLARDWIGVSRPMDRAAALTELAVRYLASHGPAEPADLAFWSGIRLRDARWAWGPISDRLVAVETDRGTRWSLRTRTEPAPPGLVRLVPAFDEYLLGWKDREPAVPAEHRAQINRGGGWVHPAVLVDGRAIGTWRTVRAPEGLRLEITPFARLGPPARRRALAEAEDLSAFLGEPIHPALA